MKIDSDNIIKTIKNGVSLLNLQSPNEREHNIRLRSLEDNLEITGLVNDSHYFIYLIPTLESEDIIDCYIKGDRILKLLGLIKKQSDLELSIKDNCFYISHHKYGEAKESLFYNQEAFKGIVFKLEDYQSLDNKDIYYLSSYLNNLSNSILLKINKTGLSVYGYYTEGGVIQYKIENEIQIEEELKYYFKSNSFKGISYLGEETNINYSKQPLGLKFDSPLGSLIIKPSSIKNDEFEIIDFIQNLIPLGSITISYSDLLELVEWQTYNYQLGDYITLRANNSLFYVEDRNNKVIKSIECSEGDIKPTKVSISTLLTLLKTLNTKKEVEITQYLLNYGEIEIQVLVFQNSIDVKEVSSIKIRALIYEQLIYE